MNNLHYYKKYFYLELPISPALIKNGAFYRVYSYRYINGDTEVYGESHTPVIFVIGKNASKNLIHCIKINQLPIRRFLKLYDDCQNQSYTRKLIKEIEDNNKDFDQELIYSSGRKAVLIDRSGRNFYNKQIRNNSSLEQYDIYRTYKKRGIKQIKELYFDVSKLKEKLGFKNNNII